MTNYVHNLHETSRVSKKYNLGGKLGMCVIHILGTNEKCIDNKKNVHN